MKRVRKYTVILTYVLFALAIITLILGILLAISINRNQIFSPAVLFTASFCFSAVWATAYADQYKGWTPFHYTSGDTVYEGYANKAQGGAWYVMLAPFLGFSTYSYYNLSQIQDDE